MRILAIETSCDETAVAVCVGHGQSVGVETSLVRSQIDIHQAYGGVVPEVAAREHLEMMMPMLMRAVRHDGEGIDAIAVTYGPGLAPALRIGVEAAKTLAWAWKKPLIPVCHLEGHIYANWIQKIEVVGSRPEGVIPQFPVLALIVSGGHTELVLMREHGVFERLGETLDDAAGEAFDKVAKMLGLPYPGGPAVDRLATQGNPHAFAFPRAMLDRDDGMFSFSGLKTSVLYELRRQEERLADDAFRADIAASFQEAVVDVLVQKTMRAAGTYQPASIVLAGGVAANAALRHRLQDAAANIGTPVFLPDFAYSLDNAAMIGAAGYFRAQRNTAVDPRTLVADPNADIL
jgi:N6-L-threonylcarbamoyladenine synthase